MMQRLHIVDRESLGISRFSGVWVYGWWIRGEAGEFDRPLSRHARSRITFVSVGTCRLEKPKSYHITVRYFIDSQVWQTEGLLRVPFF